MKYIVLGMITVGSILMALFIENKPKLRDYQIDIDNDSIYLWDGNIPKGAVPWDTCKFDSLLLNDNL